MTVRRGYPPSQLGPIVRLAGVVALVAAWPLGCGQPLAASAAGATPAASPSDVTITQATVGYAFGGGGLFRVHGPSLLQPSSVWVPVRVTLRNDGAADLTVGLAASTDATAGSGQGAPAAYTEEVILPAGGLKAVTLYLRAADIGSAVVLSLLIDGHVVQSTRLAAAAQQGLPLSVGVLSDDVATRGALRGLTFGATTLNTAAVGGATPLDPQPAVLDTFDLIVLANYGASGLSAGQIAAVRDWVRGGGVLLVTGGPEAQKTLGTLSPDLLAVTPRSSTVAPALPELAHLAGAAVPTGGPLALPLVQPRAGATVLAAHAGVPLVVTLPLGRGYLVYSAVTPAQAPLSTWPVAAQGAFWAQVLGPALRGPLDALVGLSLRGGGGIGGGGPLSSLAADLGAVPRQLPTRSVYVVLIVLYILVLGPGNFLLLRWRRRLEWSWVTIPLLAGLFGVGSFGLAYTRNGGDVLATVDTVVYLDPGAPARHVETYIGLHTPYRGDYDLAGAGPALVWAAAGGTSVAASLTGELPVGLRVAEGPHTSIHLAGVQMWSLRSVGLRQSLDLPGALTGHLTLRGGMVSGTVTNGTSLTLYDCVVAGEVGSSPLIARISPGQTVRIGPFTPRQVAAGGTSPPSLADLYAAAGTAGGHTRVAPLRYSTVLSAALPQGSPATATAPLALVGWSTQALARFTVNGATPHRSDLDLVVAPLEATLGTGRFTLAPGALAVSVAGTTVQPSSGPTGSGLLLADGDTLEVALALPVGGQRLSLDTLTLAVNPEDSAGLAADSAALWNWPAARWQTVDLRSGTRTLGHAAPFASPDGRVRLRLQGTPQATLAFGNVEGEIALGATGSVR